MILTRFGTGIALGMGVNSEMKMDHAQHPQDEAEVGTIMLDGAQLSEMRSLLHELSNVLTGLMISGGLLAQYLAGNVLRPYAAGVCEGCERGGVLLFELRSRLLAAWGEADAGTLGGRPGGQDTKAGPLQGNGKQACGRGGVSL